VLFIGVGMRWLCMAGDPFDRAVRAECRLSRVDLSSDDQEPIINEFIRLLESNNIDVLDHHREGGAFSFGIFVYAGADLIMFRAVRGDASPACRRGFVKEGRVEEATS
jgi:hypothetical protein